MDWPEPLRRDPAATAVLVGGLTPAQVRDRVLAGQVNTQPPAPGRTVAQIFRANVLTRFNAILGALFVLVMIVGPPQDALFGMTGLISVTGRLGPQAPGR